MTCSKEFKTCERITDEETLAVRRARFASGIRLVPAAQHAGVSEATLCHYENIAAGFPNMPREIYNKLMLFYHTCPDADDRKRARYFLDDRVSDEQMRELTRARKSAGISRRQVAEKFGISQNTLFHWENGNEHKNAPAPLFSQLMDFYNDRANWSARALKAYENACAREAAVEMTPKTKRAVRRAADRVADIDAASVLRKMRAAAAMTLDEAARLSKLGRASISTWERGEHRPDKASYELLCGIYLMRTMRNRNEAQKLYDEFVA